MERIRSFRQSINYVRFEFRLALNEGQHIVDELLLDAVVCIVDPLERDLLFIVCNGRERKELRLAGVVTVHGLALEGNHLVGDADNGVFYRGTTGHDGLFNVGLRGQVCAAALEQRQLDAAYLRAGLFLHDARQQRGEAAELRVAKAVRRAGLGLGDKAAIGIPPLKSRL